MSAESFFADHVSQLLRSTAALLHERELDAMVIHSGQPALQRSVDDQHWPLRVHPTFGHFCPLQESDLFLVISADARATLFREDQVSIWEGPAPFPGQTFLQPFSVVKGGMDKVREHVKGERAAFVGESADVCENLGLTTDTQLEAGLAHLRTRKSEYEVACLRESTKIAVRGHKHLQEIFCEGHHSELGLQLSYLRATEQDAFYTPYGNIVAQGRNAAILHHIHYDRRVDDKPDQTLLVDAGASYLGYASDITRTIVRGDSDEARDFQALIDGVEKLQVALCSEVRPGLNYETLHDRSHELLASLFLEQGLCSGSAEELIASGVTRAFYPHGLGHSLGLQVHDVGCKLLPSKVENPFLRNTSEIQEGQVFTIEPGCYFIDGLLTPLRETKEGGLVNWNVVERLWPFGGIRIEDNLLVTADGSENLTRELWN